MENWDKSELHDSVTSAQNSLNPFGNERCSDITAMRSQSRSGSPIGPGVPAAAERNKRGQAKPLRSLPVRSPAERRMREWGCGSGLGDEGKAVGLAHRRLAVCAAAQIINTISNATITITVAVMTNSPM